MIVSTGADDRRRRATTGDDGPIMAQQIELKKVEKLKPKWRSILFSPASFDSFRPLFLSLPHPVLTLHPFIPPSPQAWLSSVTMMMPLRPSKGAMRALQCRRSFVSARCHVSSVTATAIAPLRSSLQTSKRSQSTATATP